MWIEHDANNQPGRYVWLRISVLPPGRNEIYLARIKNQPTNKHTPEAGRQTFPWFDDFTDPATLNNYYRGGTGGQQYIENGRLVLKVSNAHYCSSWVLHKTAVQADMNFEIVGYAYFNSWLSSNPSQDAPYGRGFSVGLGDPNRYADTHKYALNYRRPMAIHSHAYAYNNTFHLDLDHVAAQSTSTVRQEEQWWYISMSRTTVNNSHIDYNARLHGSNDYRISYSLSWSEYLAKKSHLDAIKHPMLLLTHYIYRKSEEASVAKFDWFFVRKQYDRYLAGGTVRISDDVCRLVLYNTTSQPLYDFQIFVPLSDLNYTTFNDDIVAFSSSFTHSTYISLKGNTSASTNLTPTNSTYVQVEGRPDYTTDVSPTNNAFVWVGGSIPLDFNVEPTNATNVVLHGETELNFDVDPNSSTGVVLTGNMHKDGYETTCGFVSRYFYDRKVILEHPLTDVLAQNVPATISFHYRTDVPVARYRVYLRRLGSTEWIQIADTPHNYVEFSLAEVGTYEWYVEADIEADTLRSEIGRFHLCAPNIEQFNVALTEPVHKKSFVTPSMPAKVPISWEISPQPKQFVATVYWRRRGNSEWHEVDVSGVNSTVLNIEDHDTYECYVEVRAEGLVARSDTVVFSVVPTASISVEMLGPKEDYAFLVPALPYSVPLSWKVTTRAYNWVCILRYRRKGTSAWSETEITSTDNVVVHHLPLDRYGFYEWQVEVRTPADSAITPVRLFGLFSSTFLHFAPWKARALSPASGSVLFGRTVTFSWEISEPLEHFAVAVCWRKAGGEWTSVILEDAYSYTTTLPDYGVYEWRVTIIDRQQNVDITPVVQFAVVKESVNLGCETAITPVEPSVQITANLPAYVRFSWKLCVLIPDTTYFVVARRGQEVYTTWSDDTFTYMKLLKEGDYSWRVVAVLPDGSCAESTEGMFTLNRSPEPFEVIPLIPQDGATLYAPDVPSEVLIHWATTKPAKAVVFFKSDQQTNWNSYELDEKTDRLTLTLGAFTTYSWYVSASNDEGSAQSRVCTFRLERIESAVIDLLSPKNDAILEPAVMPTGDTPFEITLSWSSNIPMKSYEVRYRKETEDREHSKTTQKQSTVLAITEPGTYIWYVRGVRADTGSVVESEPFRFTVIEPMRKFKVVPVSPENNAVIASDVPCSVRLSWELVGVTADEVEKFVVRYQKAGLTVWWDVETSDQFVNVSVLEQAEYRWYVEAWLKDGSYATSEVRNFTVQK